MTRNGTDGRAWFGERRRPCNLQLATCNPWIQKGLTPAAEI